ncbi:MAG: phage/plasmid primase, P4 family [Gemmataceae bacterium]
MSETKQNQNKLNSKLADCFLASWGQTYKYYGGLDYRYECGRWVKRGGEDKNGWLEHTIRQFLNHHQCDESNTIVANVCEMVRSRARIDEVVYPTMPFWQGLNGDCPFSDPNYVLSFPNGMLDLLAFQKSGTAQLHPLTSDWFNTNAVNFDFEPDAKCSRWLQFLDEVYEGDPERIALLQEWMGLLLVPETRYHKWMILVGKPRSGKSTIQTITGKLLENNACAFSLRTLGRQFGTSALLGKLVALVGEIELRNEPQRFVIEEAIKSITGGDVQQIAWKYRNAVTSQILTARLFCSTNALPDFYDQSSALSKRMLVLDHQRSYYGKEDVHLLDKLESELPGVCLWAISGLFRLIDNDRFTVPQTMKTAISEFQMEESPVLCFLKDRCQIAAYLDPDDLPNVTKSADPTIFISRDNLYSAYSSWCLEHGKGVIVNSSFGKSLKTALPKLNSGEQRPKRNGVYVYLGVDLLPKDEQK